MGARTGTYPEELPEVVSLDIDDTILIVRGNNIFTASASILATGGITVENVLTSDSETNALSAAQGKALSTALSSKAALVSPAFTGNPTAPTAAAETDNTEIATTAFVHDAIATVGSDHFPRYDQAQTLTDPQKAQILTNIGAKKSYNLINKTASYTLALTDFQNSVDLYDKVYLRMNLTAIGDVTISSALTSLPNLTEISVRDLGTARATLVESGTVLNGIKTFTVQNEVKTLVKVGANEWDIIGALT